ncbi:MAG: YidC/Oxa1 family membrane protein insertase [Clostridia bacterium]|nr:YidC/Oxa1 family membrane protein insertase [Clostridia bacterium]
MNDFMTGILAWLYTILGNYGWAMVVFTLLIRLVLMPFDYKSRVSMRKMAKVQPKMAELQKKYAKDQNKLNQKMSELYKQENVSPLSGCLPMLLSYPILIIMFSAMRSFANQQVVRQVVEILQNPDVLPAFDGWLWIRNLWMPDSPFAASLPDYNTLRMIPSDIWLKFMNPELIATLPEALSSLTVDSFAGSELAGTITLISNYLQSLPVYESATAILPGWTFNLIFFSFSIMKEFNGLFLLPIFSGVSQFLMTKLTPQQQPQAQVDPNQPNTGKFMNWFFPIFSLWICSSYNGAFALYWVTSNLIAIAQTFIINKMLDEKEKKQANLQLEAAKK